MYIFFHSVICEKFKWPPLTLSQISRGFHVSAVRLSKTLWEKEKLLTMSYFFFSCCVFSNLRLLSVYSLWVWEVNNLLFGKGLSTTKKENFPSGWIQNGFILNLFNPFPHNDTFWSPLEASLLKTLWEKEKLLVTSNFSFTYSVFYPFREVSAIFIKVKIVVYKLFQFGPVYNFVVW